MRFRTKNHHKYYVLKFLAAAIILLISACTPIESMIVPATSTLAATATATQSPTATLTLIPTVTATPSPTPTPVPVVLMGAGDISICGQDGDNQTAAILQREQPDAIFTAGDNSNGEGLPHEYTECFNESWGQFYDRIYPSPGNHEYYTEKDAYPYFDYYGPRAGERFKGWYSYDLGEWHIVAINSNCQYIGGCGPSSPEVQWLREDLAANSSKCTLAYWHHPRFTSGLADDAHWLDAFWQTLYEFGAEVVINGHDHDYERFALQDPLGNPDPEKGIRQFVAGTGGASQRAQGEREPNSEVFYSGQYGVLKFTLLPDSYQWEFIPTDEGGFRDMGETRCHW